jgi:hypothetical protein
MGRLKPGETMRIKTLDPTSMAIEDLVVKALRKEPRDVLGVPTDTTALSVSFHGVELLSWVDANGRVVRQETPFGWIMEACTAEDAMAIKVDARDAEDMMGSMAVDVIGAPDDLRGVEKLRLRLRGITPGRHLLASNRQVVEETGSNTVVLSLSAARWPKPGDRRELAPADRKLFLNATPFVQAADPDILARAQFITKNCTDDEARARAIYEWVYKNVEKKVTVSLPSAVDVLKNLEGDCNEHTYLFTALARSIGLPTQMRIGLFFKDGKFYYHAWPSVFVGDWVDMDPTIGQELADAAHVGLQEGELSNQLGLLELIGRLQAEVLGAEQRVESRGSGESND